MSSKLEQLQALLAPVVEALGYQCWGIEFISQGGIHCCESISIMPTAFSSTIARR